MTEKEEITSTEFPEGGDTTYTKGPPASPRGSLAFTRAICDLFLMVFFVLVCFFFTIFYSS